MSSQIQGLLDQKPDLGTINLKLEPVVSETMSQGEKIAVHEKNLEVAQHAFEGVQNVLAEHASGKSALTKKERELLLLLKGGLEASIAEVASLVFKGMSLPPPQVGGAMPLRTTDEPGVPTTTTTTAATTTTTSTTGTRSPLPPKSWNSGYDD